MENMNHTAPHLAIIGSSSGTEINKICYGVHHKSSYEYLIFFWLANPSALEDLAQSTEKAVCITIGRQSMTAALGFDPQKDI
jgi:hypothetical protein